MILTRFVEASCVSCIEGEDREVTMVIYRLTSVVMLDGILLRDFSTVY
jgi:hypothetical protein